MTVPQPAEYVKLKRVRTLILSNGRTKVLTNDNYLAPVGSAIGQLFHHTGAKCAEVTYENGDSSYYERVQPQT